MKKNLVGSTMALVFILFFVATTLAQEVRLELFSTQNETQLKTTIYFVNNGEVVAAQFDIIYDSEGLTSGKVLGEVSLGERGFTLNAKEISPGRIRVIIIPPIKSPPPLLPNGPLTRLSFLIERENVEFPSLSDVILSNAKAERLGVGSE